MSRSRIIRPAHDGEQRRIIADCELLNERLKGLFAEYISFSRQSVTEESNSTQNDKYIYREVAKYAKHANNEGHYFLIQSLQDFLSYLRAFAVPSSRSGLSGLGIHHE